MVYVGEVFTRVGVEDRMERVWYCSKKAEEERAKKDYGFRLLEKQMDVKPAEWLFDRRECSDRPSSAFPSRVLVDLPPCEALTEAESKAVESKVAELMKKTKAEFLQLLEQKLDAMQGEMKDVKGEVKDVKGVMKDVKGEMKNVQSDVRNVHGEVKGISKRMLSLEERGVADGRESWEGLGIAPRTFEGRRTELELVQKTLLSSRAEILSIIGPGGQGKSTLLRQALGTMMENGKPKEELARRFVDGMLWYSFEDKPSLSGWMLTLVKRFRGNVDDVEHETSRLLGQKTMLLVFDGAEAIVDYGKEHKEEWQLARLLAMNSRCTCCITSRYESDKVEGGEIICLEELEKEESESLFLKIHPLSKEAEARGEILSMLGGVPLAIHMAACYLRQKTK